jgi:hypothetical protein
MQFGVGQDCIAAIVPSGIELRCSCDLPTEFFDSLTLIVGQDEDPFPLVRRAAFTRARHAPRRSVTHSGQVLQHVGKPKADMSLDVFSETDTWSHESNSGCDKWPEVSWVFGAESLAGG